jgi:hypothetical protein
MTRALLTIGGIGLFFLVLWLGVRSDTQFECEACVSYAGRSECRTVLGATRQDAQAGAMSNVCGFLTGGVTDTIRCQSTAPDRLRCREL